MSGLKGFFSGVKSGMRVFGENISLIVNSLLLFAVYVVGVGLTSIAARIFGKHFLDFNRKRKQTYWINLNLKKKKQDDYYRQF